MKDYFFVSDIHGRNLKLEIELKKIAQDKESKPKIIFFLGDIVGTEKLDKLQKLFYNGIVNHVRKLLIEKPDATDIEILSLPIGDNKIVADGGQEIQEFLFGKTNIDVANNIKYIRELAQYVHFGHFVSNLPKEIKAVLQKDMEDNAKIWIDIMTQFTNQGTNVVIIEGNWDARTPLDFYPTTECKPLPIKERGFYLKDFLKSLNDKVRYFDQVGTIETENEIFVLWPFDSAVEATMVPEFDENQETKKIILVSHAQIDWSSVNGDKPMTNEGRKIQDNMPMTFDDVKADTAVHGHLHDSIGTDGYLFKQKFIHYLPKDTCRFIDF